ncbi:hypothetical protein [Shewanella sp. HN-41]|uniref:hypothetical protein n=1 Tax=Shewanella sp. HN-41 TaxID=327275 RepID=UPI001111A0C1|nr:hypothetical protein [Shewanella sp. HN-41]
MPDYKFCVSLNISHPSMEVQTISEQLSLQPTSSHDVGDLRVTKHGRQLGGTYEDMRWSLDLCNGNKFDAETVLFEDFISSKNAEFKRHKSFFNHIRSSGGTIEYFVGWFSVDSINMTIYLEPSLLKSTADLDISIVLCAYPED